MRKQIRNQKGKLGRKGKEKQTVGSITSYPAPIKITPKSCTDALGRVSENSCLRMASEECKNFHLILPVNSLVQKFPN